jgi:hypothetical protein
MTTPTPLDPGRIDASNEALFIRHLQVNDALDAFREPVLRDGEFHFVDSIFLESDSPEGDESAAGERGLEVYELMLGGAEPIEFEADLSEFDPTVIVTVDIPEDATTAGTIAHLIAATRSRLDTLS